MWIVSDVVRESGSCPDICMSDLCYEHKQINQAVSIISINVLVPYRDNIHLSLSAGQRNEHWLERVAYTMVKSSPQMYE